MTEKIRESLAAALGEQYSIIRLVGRGGMGMVYLAHDNVLDRTVAIKVLPPEIATPIGVERFRREAQTAAKLSHPNIVPLHSFGEVNGMMYFVMGYVPGGSLSDRLRSTGSLPANSVREILVAVADALDYAHRQGVIHRDIKPDNILIDEESGRPMLTDFGIAKGGASGGTLTMIGMPIGTPLYMSPEQASGEVSLDGRSDLYSLGVTGYQLLCGKPPFSEGQPQEILAQHVSKKPEPLKKIAPDVPDDLASTVMRCLAKAPNDRWRDAAQMRNALQHAHAGIVEKRTWFDGLLLGTIAPAVWIVAVLVFGLAAATNPEVSLSDFGLDSFLIPVTVTRPLFGFVLLALPILGMTLAQARRAGWSMAYIGRLLLRQPGWWRGWYPASLRHPATAHIWRRLPLGLKFLYTAFDMTVIVLLFTLLPATALLVAVAPETIEAYQSSYWPFFGEIVSSRPRTVDVTVAQWACVFGYLAVLIWAQRRGLSLSEAHQIGSARALAPTHEAMTFWRRPHVEVLLTEKPAAPRGEQELPRSPMQCLERIKRCLVTGADLTSGLRSRAEQAAVKIVDNIGAVDAEIASLQRNADQEQISNLERKLEGKNLDELSSDTEREMHDLERSQLRLLLRVSDRLEVAKRQRSKQMDILKALWREIERSGSGSHAKIGALCDDAERNEPVSANALTEDGRPS